MRHLSFYQLFIAITCCAVVTCGSCISSGDQNTINNALTAGRTGIIVQLCQNALIRVSGPITFTADNQEISTEGYPTDSSRATIQIMPGNAASTIIAGGGHSGIRLMNIQLDGNRPNAGYQKGGGANIEFGGKATGQLVSHVASRNPRGWSCMHIIGSGDATNPCARAEVVNNDIGPCGQSGTDAAGNGLWADGISLDCTQSLVQDNIITGPTDGGIVIFGSPGSTINRNTIISSDQYLGFGAINMVDGQYNGSYTGVTVSNNRIVGKKILNLGIGIGANIWSFNDPYALRGPVSITGNKFTGNIAFSMAINGWADGITAAKNDASGVTTPKASFSDASHCSGPIQELFNKNANFAFYPAGVTGPLSLQPEFVASSGNITNFLCTTMPLPNSVQYSKGQLDIISDSPPFASLHGIIMQYQGDNNVVVLDTTTGKPQWASGHTISGGCGSPSKCHMVFQSDGNLVTYYDNTPQWTSQTGGRGASLICKNSAPWMQILDDAGNSIWDTTQST